MSKVTAVLTLAVLMLVTIGSASAQGLVGTGSSHSQPVPSRPIYTTVWTLDYVQQFEAIPIGQTGQVSVRCGCNWCSGPAHRVSENEIQWNGFTTMTSMACSVEAVTPQRFK